MQQFGQAAATFVLRLTVRDGYGWRARRRHLAAAKIQALFRGYKVRLELNPGLKKGGAGGKAGKKGKKGK
jgi:hypothetical protein